MIGMTSHRSHLEEERLFECYLSVRAGESLDPAVIEHLDDCPECAGRYADLTQFMDGLRDDAEADTDAVFAPDHLQQQQRDIARRLEFVGRSARVINFPQPNAGRQMPTGTRRPFPRWVAATAAAGLVAGMVAGMFLERAGHRGGGAPVAMATRPAAVAAPVAAPPVVESSTAEVAATEAERQDTFLSELELAADRPRTAELAAYDDWTPHIREASYRVAGR